MRKSWSPVVAAALVLVTAVALAQAPESPPDGWYRHHDDWGVGHMIFRSLMMIGFWGGLIVATVLAVRHFGHGAAEGNARRSSDRAPLELIEERFARGELGRQEFACKRALFS